MIINDEAVKKAIIDSGWSEERTVDISEYIKWYNNFGYDIPDKVREVISAFGGLTLKIPCYRYYHAYISRKERPTKETDLNRFLVIDPAKFLQDEYRSDAHVREMRAYTNDISSFYGIREVYPIAYTTDSEEDYYLGENGELIASYSGACICYGISFEEGIKRIMTDENTDMKSIYAKK